MKQYQKFQSQITKEILGQGIIDASMVSRDECKLYLQQVAEVANKDNWIKMVVNGFIGDNASWDIKTMNAYLNKLKDDINQIKLRLMELSK